jgi:hypothetical protein
MNRGHDFPYQPVPHAAADDDGSGADLVVATSVFVNPTVFVRALESEAGAVVASSLLASPPIYWTRLRLPVGRPRADVARALEDAGVPVRYVASARRQSMVLPPPLSFEGLAHARPKGWRVRPSTSPHEPTSDARWFLRSEGGGIAVDRALCGTGAGTRLALIDDDAADFDQLDFDAIVPVGDGHISSASGHGALLVGWAVGGRTYGGGRFAGVAPDASVRTYMIPRPGDDVFSMPLAIARAAIDGADVILCATYVEGTTTPMLDDALEFASRRGRRGRGCAVVFPTGRETSSPEGSMHASLSISFADPASDPRIFCVAPGGREGGWFLWRSRKGALRPFANRGPAARWLAPGDDLVHPFLASDRLFHAESSGASAVAAGVLLLVLSCNPTLRVDELAAVVTRCARDPVPISPAMLAALADPVDVLPLRRDRDGHDAKHGYGRVDAASTCAVAADPISLELWGMGEAEAALAWCEGRGESPVLRSAYSSELARWAVRVLLNDAEAEHALRSILRHMRLVASDLRRARAHASGAVARHLALLLRALARSHVRASGAVRRELALLEVALRTATRDAASSELEELLVTLAREVFTDPAGASMETLPPDSSVTRVGARPRSTALGTPDS